MRVYLAGLKVRDRVNVQEVILTRAKVGLVLLNSQLRIDYANPVAKDIFTRGTTLQHKDQMLYTPHRRENVQLGKMLTEVRQVPNRRATTMSISSSLGEAALSVVALNGRTLRATSRGSVAANSPTFVTVLLRDRATRHIIDPNVLQRSFGLTPAEARVATSLVQGHSLEEIASQKSVSKETIRKHLRRVFSKTGTNRQANLVALLASGIECLA